MFQNIGMCVELLPITGIPLPLVSYSGTFVVMCMFMLGLVQSVWVHRNVVPSVEEDEPERRFASNPIGPEGGATTLVRM